MFKTFLFLPLASVIGMQQEPQVPVPDRKVRIEVVTTENGETKRVTKEFDANDDAQMQEALRELGVLNHMKLGQGERDITIDIRGFGEGEDSDVFMRMAPMAPMPPVPPDAPMAFAAAPSAYLGVSTRNLAPDDKRSKLVKKGAVVLEVMKESPAEKLGLKEGDIITELGGKAVDGPGGLAELVRAHKPGESVKLVWLRDGRTMKGEAKLSERKSEAHAFSFDTETLKELEKLGESSAWRSEKRAFLGVTPSEERSADQGTVIGTVEAGSAAEKMGLLAGDRITAINGEAVSDFDALAERIRSMEPGERITVTALRDGQAQEHTGTLGERRSHRYHNGTEGMEGFRWNGMAPEDRDALRREMDQLRREMDELRREMGKDIRREVRVRVQARELSEDEKALLRNKGVAVDKELKLDGLQAFPNPSSGFYRLQFDVAERADLNVDVHNAKGERVYQEHIVGFKGRYERTLDLSDQASGSYYLVIAQGGKAATVKLVKE
ncbi:MAG TPA: PDZ domain-containing protein [Flavobacteriales bacterium]|nr:PDZ domain-containing protein [Flavobacteriales bacterium]